MRLSGDPAAEVEPSSITGRFQVPLHGELLVRDRPPGKVSLPRGHTEHVLFVSTGSPLGDRPPSSSLLTNDEEYHWKTCPRGGVTFIPAGMPFEWSWSYASSSLHLTIPDASFTSVSDDFRLEDGSLPPLSPMFRAVDEPLRRMLGELHQESAGSALGSDLVASSLLMLILARLLRGSVASSPRDLDGGSLERSPLDQRRCLEFMNDHLAERLTLKELAREFGLSQSHFCRLFKRLTGYPPHEYQLQLRIARARELLRARPARTVASMAEELGFSSESHLRRHFRRIVGVSPSKYRASA